MGVAAGGLADRLAAPRIAVLGPVAIGAPDSLRPVPGRSARLLVALVAAGRPRTIDQLSETVWGDDLPATHRAALHVHLTSLRRALAGVSAACGIERVGAGYVLEPAGCEVDAVLAADLLAAADAAAAAAPQSALDLVEEALALWRGTPFAVDGEVVDVPGWHRLEAARHDAEELRIELLLATGQAALAESAALDAVHAEPLRERRWGQLLRAQYLAGRTADALATYRRARSTLIDALGIEPGAELRALEVAALTHDTARLRIPASQPTAMPGPPPADGALIGRDEEVRRVAARLAHADRVVVTGPAGVGKTRLAVEVVRESGPRPVAWLDARDDLLDAGALGEWIRHNPEGLVVIDNVDAPTGPAMAALSELRASGTVAVLVTSRVPLPVPMAVEALHPLEVPVLEGPDAEIEATPAARALRAALHELAPAAVLSAAEIAVVCRRSGGLPLVLRLMAAAAQALPPRALVELPASVAGDDVDRATRAVLRALDGETVAAFASLSVLGGEFDDELGARVTGLSLDRFRPVLVALVHHGLVQARLDRVRPHHIPEPVRAVGLRVLMESGDRRQVVDRHADACLDRARALHELAITGDVSDLDERFRADLPRLRQALDHLVSIDDDERALRLVCRLEAPLYVLGWWAEKVELFDLALRSHGKPSRMRARAHIFRARPGPLHLLDASHAERGEAIADELGDEVLAAFARSIRSLASWWSGDTTAAIDLASDAAAVFAAAGKTAEWCEARKFLGVAHVLDGDAELGLQIQREVLEVLRRELGSSFNVAHTLAYLGHCHRYLGDDTAAWADWTEAAELCQRIGNRGTAIHIHIGLAEIAADRGGSDDALAQLAHALRLVDAGGASTYEPWAWTVAMRAHALAGDEAAALACARRAVAGLARAPSGETARLAADLARVALDRDDAVSAARLLGVALSTPDVREIPFASPAERARRAVLRDEIVGRLGDTTAASHLDAGRRCTLTEAAGALLAS